MRWVPAEKIGWGGVQVANIPAGVRAKGISGGRTECSGRKCPADVGTRGESGVGAECKVLTSLQGCGDKAAKWVQEWVREEKVGAELGAKSGYRSGCEGRKCLQKCFEGRKCPRGWVQSEGVGAGGRARGESACRGGWEGDKWWRWGSARVGAKGSARCKR